MFHLPEIDLLFSKKYSSSYSTEILTNPAQNLQLII